MLKERAVCELYNYSEKKTGRQANSYVVDNFIVSKLCADIPSDLFFKFNIYYMRGI